MELKTTNAVLLLLNTGCHELLEVEELETLFALRVSLIIEALLPSMKAYEKTNEKLSKQYRTVDVKDKEGVVTGKRPKSSELEEYIGKVQVLLDAGVNIKVPTLRMSDLHRMREEEDLPILSSTLHKTRPIIKMDMELPDSNELEDTEEKTEDTDIPRKKSRSERLKATTESKE